MCLILFTPLPQTPLRPMTCLVIGLWLYNGSKYGFYLVEQDLNQKVPGYFNGIHALLQQWMCLARPIIIVAHQAQIVVKLMTTFLLQ